MLLTTFTNPAPADYDFFGNAVAAVGTDRVLIAAKGDDTGAADAGAAYLFSTNGTLLATFNNPKPTPQVFFGASVAAVGTDRVLIGATWDNTGATHAGAAYLFRTNGALLTTFNNPTPADYEEFGKRANQTTQPTPTAWGCHRRVVCKALAKPPPPAAPVDRKVYRGTRIFAD